MPPLLQVSSSQQWRTAVSARLGSGEAALAVDATKGFLYVPTCPGVPVGIPEAQAGMAPLVFDSSGGKLYAYTGGWVAVGP